ncbi:MAG: hypothetical protein HOY79_36840 [Streptomyces sp.]|nr:hypothetical protein [Streptomyces sp.]
MPFVRRPETRPVSGQPTVEIRRADVTAPAAFPDLTDVDVVVSALGIGKGDGQGTLIAGARIFADVPVRTLWLGALGSGSSAGAGGGIYQWVMKAIVGEELAEKAAADSIALDGGATVFHAPDLRAGSVSTGRRNIPLEDHAKPVLPPYASRAAIAALMLDEAERPTRAAGIPVPVGRI